MAESMLQYMAESIGYQGEGEGYYTFNSDGLHLHFATSENVSTYSFIGLFSLFNGFIFSSISKRNWQDN